VGALPHQSNMIGDILSDLGGTATTSQVGEAIIERL
jgi:hypothetical protein